MSRFDEIKQLIEGIEEDLGKFYEKGNKAAGTRARKGLQEVKKKAQEIRVEILEIRKRGDTDTGGSDFGGSADYPEAEESGGSDDW